MNSKSGGNDPYPELQRAVEFQRAGRLADAEASYRRVLRMKSSLDGADQAGVHFNLGNVQLELGRPEYAARNYREALAIRADWSEASSNLGAALRRLGRPVEAVAAYRQALERISDDPQVHFNL